MRREADISAGRRRAAGRRVARVTLSLTLGILAGAVIGTPDALSAIGSLSVGTPTVTNAIQVLNGVTLPLPTVSVSALTVTTPSVPGVSVPAVTVTTPSVPAVGLPGTTTTVTSPNVPQVTTVTVPTSTHPPRSPTTASAAGAPSARNGSPPRASNAARHRAPAPEPLSLRHRAGAPAHRSSHARSTTPAVRVGKSAVGRSSTTAEQPTTDVGSRARSPKAGPSLPDLIGRSIPLPLPVPDWSKPIILALMVLSIGFGVRTRVTSVRARRLTLEHQALAADLDAMQLALVPEIPSRLGGLALSVAYRPADGPAAGGDFYDAVALDGSRVAIVLGDVSGHGRTALAHAARMRYTLMAYIEAGLSPREALKLAGSVVGTSDDGCFTTVVVAIHDASAASLTYAAAGHPAPLVSGHIPHRPRTTCVSPPLGWGIPCGRRQTVLPFAQGDRACFFSDGLTEARTEHGLLGRGRVAAMLAGLGAIQSASALLEEVQAQATQIRDDMAACLIEAERGIAGAGEPSCLEELELDPEQSSLAQGRRFLRGWGLPRHEIDEAISHAHATASDHGLALLTLALPSRSWAVTPSVAPTIRAARPLPLGVATMASPDLLPTKPARPGDRSHPHPLSGPSSREAAR